jgi:hypothetical protein
MPYNNQENAWYDRDLVIWWAWHVFAPWYFGDKHFTAVIRMVNKKLLVYDGIDNNGIMKEKRGKFCWTNNKKHATGFYYVVDFDMYHAININIDR